MNQDGTKIRSGVGGRRAGRWPAVGFLRADPMKKIKKNAHEKCTCALFFELIR
jgi:hypothetical protein